MFLPCCMICEKNLWYDLKKKIINMCVFAGFLLSPWCRLGYGWTRFLKIPPSGGPLPQPSPYIWYIQYICEQANFRRMPLRMFFTFFDTHTHSSSRTLCAVSLSKIRRVVLNSVSADPLCLPYPNQTLKYTDIFQVFLTFSALALIIQYFCDLK